MKVSAKTLDLKEYSKECVIAGDSKNLFYTKCEDPKACFECGKSTVYSCNVDTRYLVCADCGYRSRREIFSKEDATLEAVAEEIIPKEDIPDTKV